MISFHFKHSKREGETVSMELETKTFNYNYNHKRFTYNQCFLLLCSPEARKGRIANRVWNIASECI